MAKPAPFSILKSQSQKREPKLTHEQEIARHHEQVFLWLREHGKESEIPRIKAQFLESQKHAEERRKALQAAVDEDLRRMAKRKPSTYQYDPDEEVEDDRQDEYSDEEIVF
jgi:hypothetical protein